jgi:Skp family chaperone for outer membrane proteins
MLRTVLTATTIVVAVTSTAFAQGADAIRIGAINLSYVARTSKIGKSEIAKIEDASRQKAAEIEIKAAELQRRQAEFQKTAIGLTPRALADLQRTFEKSRVELDRFRQDVQTELAAMQTKFELDFRAKLTPVIDEVSKEKGLHFVFGLEEAAIVWWSPAVDISDEVVKRLDGGKR